MVSHDEYAQAATVAPVAYKPRPWAAVPYGLALGVSAIGVLRTPGPRRRSGWKCKDPRVAAQDAGLGVLDW